MLFMLFTEVFNFFTYKAAPWSSVIVLGTSWIWIHSSKNFTTLGPFVCQILLQLGIWKKRSIHERKCISWSFLLVICPRKSIWISSVGSEQLTQGCHLDDGIIDLEFLPLSVHGLQLATFLNISRCICGQNAYWPRVTLQPPGCVRCRDTSTASWIELGIANRSSSHAHNQTWRGDCTRMSGGRHSRPYIAARPHLRCSRVPLSVWRPWLSRRPRIL